jgi:hypothetical protein
MCHYIIQIGAITGTSDCPAETKALNSFQVNSKSVWDYQSLTKFAGHKKYRCHDMGEFKAVRLLIS